MDKILSMVISAIMPNDNKEDDNLIAAIVKTTSIFSQNQTSSPDSVSYLNWIVFSTRVYPNPKTRVLNSFNKPEARVYIS